MKLLKKELDNRPKNSLLNCYYAEKSYDDH